MRKIISLLWIGLATLSCEKGTGVDYALFSGKILNPQGNNIVINQGAFNYEVSLNSEGVFYDTLRVKSGYYSLSYGRNMVNTYIEPGFNLNIEMDSQNLNETIVYTGVGAEINNYIKQKNSTILSLQGNSMQFYSLDEADFLTKVNEIHNSNLDLLNTVVEASDEFLVNENENLKFDAYVALNNFERNHQYYTQNNTFQVSDGFLPEELVNMTFDNSDYYNWFLNYKQLASGKLMSSILEPLDADFSSLTPLHLEEMKNSPIEALKNDIGNSLGVFFVSPGNPKMKEIYDFFMTHTTDEALHKRLTNKYEGNKNILPGMVSPDFANYENHKGGTVSLADLRGKYVYIDIWATWCGPCIREIPALKELEHKYENTKLQFVSISIDDARRSGSDEKAHQAWTTFVKEKELGGLQLFSDKAWQSDFIRGYGINGIPRFILIGPDGNIVSGDAPRPSSPALSKLFDSLDI